MNIKDFKDSLDYLFKAEVTPFIWGHAGIGKSSIVKQYAKSKGYHFFPFYLGTQSDLGDILGLADFVRNEQGTAVATTFATPEWLKNAIDYCNNNPSSGAIIFLDEFNRARRDILNGMFSLALDKTFHTLKLPRNCHIVAAGNPPTDEYFVTDVNETALMARFVHVKLEPSFEEWVSYAKDIKIENSLIGFLQDQPQLLEESRSNFELPIKVDRRSYERLSKLFILETPTHLLEQLMAGIIGLERTVAYKRYLADAEKPLSGADVLTEGRMNKIVEWADSTSNMKISLLTATCDNVKTHILQLTEDALTDKEKGNLMEFFTVMPKDISFTMLQSLFDRKTILFRNFVSDERYKDKLLAMIKSVKGNKT